jgi:hypothetical protein
MNDTVNDNRERGDDLISRPPAGAVPVKRIGSWDILFAETEQSLYIVSTDYHPEPFRISLRDLKALHSSLSPKRTKHASSDTNNAKPAKKKMRRHQKRKQKR